MGGDDRSGLTRRGLLVAGAAATMVPRTSLARLVSPRQAVSVASGLAIFPRDTWAPGPPTGPLASEDVHFLLVHHTAANTQHTAAEVPGILADMYRFHTGQKGWHDVAYNFLVDREGGVWEGRAGSIAGPVAADATGGNQGSDQLVCFIGDFTAVTPTPAALDAGTRTLAWLAQRYGVDTSPGAKVTIVSRGSNKWPAGAKVTTATVAGHRDMSTTACPGNAFYPYVHTELQAAVHAARRGGSAPLAAPSTQPATTVPATTAPATTAPAATHTPTTEALTTTEASTTTTEAPTTTTEAPTTTAASTTTTVAPATTQSHTSELAAPPVTSGDGGSGLPAAIPVTAAVAGVGGALLWLRHRVRSEEPEEQSEG